MCSCASQLVHDRPCCADTPCPCVSPCSLPAAAARLVCHLLRLASLAPAPLSLQQLQAQQQQPQKQQQPDSGSWSLEPVLFITTPGADPSTELAALAEGQVRCCMGCDITQALLLVMPSICPATTSMLHMHVTAGWQGAAA